MKLTLGPVQFHWEPEEWRDFYFRIADESPFDTVVTGEVVCSKRKPFYDQYLPEVIERLKAAGKEVYLGSLLLVTLERERRQTLELIEQSGVPVEVNDLTCLASMQGKSHAIGPYINTYNEATAAYFARNGATRICLPPELPATSVATIVQNAPEVAIEVFAFGRLPLAISARCYHARLHKLSKDNCKFVCNQDPDGLTVDTMDGEHFLAMNGVQTMSFTVSNLLGEAKDLERMGVKSLRLSPQHCDMVEVARIFRDTLDGKTSVEDGQTKLKAIYPEASFSNGFSHGSSGSKWVSERLEDQMGAV
ncbi:U32 family peptidase [Microvirga sp. W0021]|uniref:Ubiquinone biosynthesis protein UbiV n=1 Tax=Hohaiivirga grylli TaxID=3133970 RepID=A0ABV0BIN7_9HYPH